MKCVPYASAVGTFMYTMVCTRPDISQEVSVVSRFMVNSGKEHWVVVKWVLRYLKGTVDTCLSFGGDTCQLNDFVDSDNASDLDRQLSNTSYIIKIYGAPISWRSMLQATMTLLIPIGVEIKMIASIHMDTSLCWRNTNLMMFEEGTGSNTLFL